jgi:hypothetical protein
MNYPLNFKKRKLELRGGKKIMNIKDWFKPVFSVFITSLLDLTAYTIGRICPPPLPQCYCPSYV